MIQSGNLRVRAESMKRDAKCFDTVSVVASTHLGGCGHRAKELWQGRVNVTLVTADGRFCESHKALPCKYLQIRTVEVARGTPSALAVRAGHRAIRFLDPMVKRSERSYRVRILPQLPGARLGRQYSVSLQTNPFPRVFPATSIHITACGYGRTIRNQPYAVV